MKEGLQDFKSSVDLMLDKPLIIKIKPNDGYNGEVLEELVFRRLSLRTVLDINPLVLSLPDLKDILDDEQCDAGIIDKELKCSEKQLKCINDNINTVIEILCLGLNNQKDPFPDWWRDFFLDNLDTWELFTLLRVVISQMHSKDFLNSIISLERGVALTDSKKMKVGSIRCNSRSMV